MRSQIERCESPEALARILEVLVGYLAAREGVTVGVLVLSPELFAAKPEVLSFVPVAECSGAIYGLAIPLRPRKAKKAKKP